MYAEKACGRGRIALQVITWIPFITSPKFYPELQKIAARFLNNERAGHTLEPNALVHELWMRLVGNDAIAFQNRAYF